MPVSDSWMSMPAEERGLQVRGLQVRGLQVRGLQVRGLQVRGLQGCMCMVDIHA